MDTYFKIKKDSILGRKFMNLVAEGQKSVARIKKLGEKHGFEKYVTSDRYAFGGLMEVEFPDGKNTRGEEIDTNKVWRKGDYGRHYYAPRHLKSTMELRTDSSNDGRISREAFDRLMNYNQVFASIGFTCYHNPDLIGVIANLGCMSRIPRGATEITASEYKKLFPEEKS